MSKFEEAVSLAKSGNLNEAKAIFEEMLLDNPKNADVLYNLGMCFTDMGQPEIA